MRCGRTLFTIGTFSKISTRARMVCAANLKLAKLFDFQTLKKKYFHWTNIIAVRMSDSDGDDDREERLNFKKKRLHFGSLEVQERAKLESGTKVCLSVISVFCNFTLSNLVKHNLLEHYFTGTFSYYRRWKRSRMRR